jgi:probable phosphomutase (TIGR03848 family)
MTTLLLIRHALTDAVGQVLTGRTPGVILNDRGRAQAEALGRRLARTALAAVYSSPLERAMATAHEIARAHGLTVECRPGLHEVDFGQWTLRTLSSLAGDPEWQRFNARRGGAPVPGGEPMLAVQARMVAEMEALAARHPEETIAVVGHGDPLRAVLLHALGVPLDLFERIEVEPASLSVVTLGPSGPCVRRLNDTGELPTSPAR